MEYRIMLVQEKLLKPIMEARYLTVENADRYRSIIRFFYLQYEKMKYRFYLEDVLEELKEDPYFRDYTSEQCQQDLNALVGWKNLQAVQDTKKAATIEEFRNKKFRYILSDTTVEIERMVIHLENLAIEGSSLEPTLLERLRIHLAELEKIVSQPPEKVYAWWKDLESDFIRLNQSYQDYMRDLNSVRAEELMKTKEFLLFKDHLIEYLRSFVKSLQLNAPMIEQQLRKIPDAQTDELVSKVTSHIMSIPQIDTQRKEETVYETILGSWKSIREWFTGSAGQPSEASRVFDLTNDIIRRITRYAARISERSNTGANRREEYRKLASLFAQCSDMNEAHRLAACVFGIERPLHLKGDLARNTQSINSSVFEERPTMLTLAPRVRTYKERATRTGIPDRSAEKEATRKRVIEQAEQGRKFRSGYIHDSVLDFASLPQLSPAVRDTFLAWLSKALESRDFHAKTEDGLNYRIENPEVKETCTLNCEDGTFRMPAYRLVFDLPEESLE